MTEEQHKWYWRGYNDAKEREQLHPMMDMPHNEKIAMAYGKTLSKSKWIGLTSEERMDIIVKHNGNRFQVADEIEEKLKEKNQ